MSTISTEGLFGAFGTAETKVQDALDFAKDNPNDSTALMKVNQEVAKYSLITSTISGITKSLRDANAAISQKM